MSDASANALMIHALMRGLVAKVGGPENAARLIAEQMGDDEDKILHATRKGTVSRRIAGSLSWPLDEILALENAVGDQRVRDWLFQSRPDVAKEASLMQLAIDGSRESGEAFSALLAMIGRKGSRADARKEVAEAVAVMLRIQEELAEEGDD